VEGRVQALAFDPAGRRLAMGDVDGTVHLRDLETGRTLHSRPTRRGALTVAWSPDGEVLVSAGFDQVIHIWDPARLEPVGDLEGHRGVVESVGFSADGRRLASGGRDNLLKVWDLDRHQLLWAREQTASVQAVGYSPAGPLAAGGRDGQVRLFDPDSGDELSVLEVGSWVQAVAFGPRGRLLAAAAWDGSVRLWNAETGLELHAALVGRAVVPTAIDFTGDGRLLAVAGSDGQVRLWDLAAGQQARALPAELGRFGQLRFRPGGGLLATAGADGIRLWSLADPSQPPRALQQPAGGSGPGARRGGRPQASLAWSPDGTRLAAGTGGALAVWEVDSGGPPRALAAPQLLAGEDDPGFNGVAFSPDGTRLAAGTSSNLVIWDPAFGDALRPLLDPAEQQPLRAADRQVRHLAWSADGTLLAGSRVDVAVVWDPESGQELHRLVGHVNNIRSLAFAPRGDRLASGGAYGPIRIWDARSGEELERLVGHTFSVDSLAFDPAGELLASASADGRVLLWQAPPDGEARYLATLVSFADGSWAVVDRDGRFDAAAGGEIPWLHWVVGSEPIELGQLKERYYEPGLLAKLLGWNREPLRDVAAFDRVELFPEVELEPPGPEDPRLGIRLTNRGGGIGRVVVRINGKEIASDARAPAADPRAEEMSLSLDLSGHPFLIPGRDNTVEVLAYNAEGYLASRGGRVTWRPAGEADLEPPTLWAIVVGVSDFSGDQLDLRYAAKDAADMATAVALAAERLFGPERLRLTLLTTDDGAPGSVPTRENLRAAFQAAVTARPTDLLLVYLAGHGVNHGGEEGDFYYLTRDATSGDLTDPALRQAAAVSSAELTEWIQQVPALKQVLILDTCASGRLVEELTETRDVPSSQVRSLERMKDRTGLYVLAGSAADAVSYETSRYGQGLLTWSLLFGMRGAALREGEFVDVSRWFDFAADRVPELAREIGGIQRPVVATPRGGASFDIGQLASADRERIPLATVRPLVVESSFQDEERFRDVLELGRWVDDSLRGAAAARGATGPVFVEAAEFPGAYSLAGRYLVDGSRVRVDVRIFLDAERVASFTVEGASDGIEALAAEILAEAGRLIGEHHAAG
jgi:WD40 repeat protein